MSYIMSSSFFRKFLLNACIVLCMILIIQPGMTEIIRDDPLYQVSTFAILETGEYTSAITIDEMNEKGDLGVGGFADMNGELIQMNGTVYQITSDGVVHTPPGDTGVTFMDTVKFNPVLNTTISGPSNFTALKDTLSESFPLENQIYAIRLDGFFSEMKIRSLPEQEEPYPPLSHVIANQSIFDLTNTTGTITGFWFPSWMQGTNYAGYHLHYLTEDHSAGGHILECVLENGTVGIDPIRSFSVDLIPEKQT